MNPAFMINKIIIARKELFSYTWNKSLSSFDQILKFFWHKLALIEP